MFYFLFEKIEMHRIRISSIYIKQIKEKYINSDNEIIKSNRKVTILNLENAEIKK